MGIAPTRGFSRGNTDIWRRSLWFVDGNRDGNRLDPSKWRIDEGSTRESNEEARDSGQGEARRGPRLATVTSQGREPDTAAPSHQRVD